MRELIILAIFAIPMTLVAQTNYVLRSGTVSQGGGVSSSSQYRLMGITGITAGGKSGNESYNLQGGMPYQAILFSIREDSLPGRPLSFQFFPPYPNPMSRRVTISFVLPKKSNVVLSVYDISGREVWRMEETLASGSHSVEWHGVDRYGHRLASGLYILRFEAGSHLVTQKLLILR